MSRSGWHRVAQAERSLRCGPGRALRERPARALPLEVSRAECHPLSQARPPSHGPRAKQRLGPTAKPALRSPRGEGRRRARPRRRASLGPIGTIFTDRDSSDRGTVPTTIAVRSHCWSRAGRPLRRRPSAPTRPRASEVTIRRPARPGRQSAPGPDAKRGLQSPRGEGGPSASDSPPSRASRPPDLRVRQISVCARSATWTTCVAVVTPRRIEQGQRGDGRRPGLDAEGGRRRAEQGPHAHAETDRERVLSGPHARGATPARNSARSPESPARSARAASSSSLKWKRRSAPRCGLESVFRKGEGPAALAAGPS